MNLNPGSPISGSKKRPGTLLAFFRSNENIDDVYLASAGHVIKPDFQYPSYTNIYYGDSVIGRHERGCPAAKLSNVDFLLAKINNQDEWSNEVPSNGTAISRILSPNIGQEVNLFGRHTSTSGKIIDVDKEGVGMYNFLIEFIGESPREGDSGAPWFTDSGELVGMHLGVLRGNSRVLRALYLSPLIEYYDIELM